MKFKIKIYPSIGNTFIIELNEDDFECVCEDEVNEWIDDHLVNVDDWMFV